MGNDSGKKSVKFVFIAIIVLLFTVFYIAVPSKNSTKTNVKSFEDMLEYRNFDNNSIQNQSEKLPPDDIEKNDENYIQSSEQDSHYTSQNQNYNNNEITNTRNLYNELLDNFAQYPAVSVLAVKEIVNELLLAKGYPENSFNIVFSDVDYDLNSPFDYYKFAELNILTGTININTAMLENSDIKTVVAVLAHEIDFADKILMVRKSLGMEQFSNIFAEKGIPGLNVGFWSSKSFYADTDKFNKELFVNALKDLLVDKNYLPINPYENFNRLLKTFQNPLKVSAYNTSNYIFDYYNVSDNFESFKDIIQKFQLIDTKLQDILNKTEFISSEKDAVFNYFYANAIKNSIREFYSEFNSCIENKEGNLNTFWDDYEKKYFAFNKYGKVTDKIYKEISTLLNNVNDSIQQDINLSETAAALQCKINTLKYNLYNDIDIKQLRSSILNYLQYIKKEGVDNPKQELNSLLLLLCIDNGLYTNNKDKDISLYSLNIPQEIQILYNIKKNRRFVFLYNNSEFKLTNTQQSSESAKLIELLNSSRVNLKSLN